MILYSTNCPNCKRLKEMLDKSGKEYDIVTDVNEMRKLGITHLPTLDIDGKMYGYVEAFKMLTESRCENAC